ncbi:MAG TPA: pirin family protein [Cytophagales bacterium]|nr:pirin family protein [Cytophagales bacterium]
MMETKKVKQLLYAHEVDMGGIAVRQPIPTARVGQIDPFLLLHHNRWPVARGSNHRHAGIGPHPHRGFSPVTFIFDGDLHHRDSRGNDRVVGAGGMQWMSSGLGLVHSERPSKELCETGGAQEVIQVWINTPARAKMAEPYYLAMEKSDIPVWPSEDEKTTYYLYSGDQGEHSGPVDSPWPVLSMRIDAESEGRFQLEIPESWNAFLYLLDGQVSLEGFGLIEGLNLAWLEKEGSTISGFAREKTRMILLASPPINEPVETYGPFVMNNQTQVMQAMRDYQMGKMGVLVEGFD